MFLASGMTPDGRVGRDASVAAATPTTATTVPSIPAIQLACSVPLHEKCEGNQPVGLWGS
jgi:hypothetical protein